MGSKKSRSGCEIGARMHANGNSKMKHVGVNVAADRFLCFYEWDGSDLCLVQAMIRRCILLKMSKIIGIMLVLRAFLASTL
jgi:hypothetical protein